MYMRHLRSVIGFLLGTTVKANVQAGDPPVRQRHRVRRGLVSFQWPLAALCLALLVVCVLPGAQIRLGASQLQGLVGSYTSLPDFTLADAPSAVTVPPGSNKPSTVTITPISGFTGTVALSLAEPSGILATSSNWSDPTKISYVFSDPQSGSQSSPTATPVNVLAVPITAAKNITLTVTAGAQVPGGTYALTITGTSASPALTHTTTLSLTVGPPLPAPLLSVGVQYAGTPYAGHTPYLQWTAVPGATSYNVYRATAAGGEGAAPIASVSAPSGSGPAYPDSAAASGPTYYYQVAAANNNGEGVRSNEASITPSASPLPAPTGLIAAPGYGVVTLTWQSVSGAAGYNVYRSGSNGGTILLAVGVSPLTYQDSSMGPGTFTYYVAGESVNGEGGQASAQATPNEFSLSLSPSTVPGVRGTTSAADIGIARSGTLTTTPVLLSLSGALPAGVSYSFFPQSPDHSGSSVYFCVGAGAATGTYSFTLTGAVPGSPSPLSHSIPVTLTVTSP